ncbi:hypothetical protein Lgra_0502 [Legionella gratiana]|uniref:Protein of uncharacterized function (DUF3757) n=1 Tax=Legionella gratiana TaxID=45066 RepID=A0A378J8N3_9GAMM|nr:DUF3757 domain-containing protein [Legionella gratiana]KTD14799.1 hypothetical protein Lgra_0502 [Legionella gratiana]STX44153.1 Protein of uncharacterised function (DUF3757) [Legionella gratiana]
MNKYQLLILGFLLTQFGVAYTTNCPDPMTSSLKWGIPPDPWVVNPVSPRRPQGDENTHFVRANILVAGYGRGVVCTYKNSVGDYSIWWPTLTKIPSRLDYNWIKTLGGFVCAQGLEQCQFYGA